MTGAHTLTATVIDTAENKHKSDNNQNHVIIIKIMIKILMKIVQIQI
jgi:hypothetical protein